MPIRFRSHALLLAAPLGLLLAACSPDPAPAPPDTPEPVAEGAASPGAPTPPVAQMPEAAPDPLPADDASMRCNADAVQSLVGQEATAAVVSQATRDSGSENSRVLAPDSVATQDLRVDRLNIHTDDAGVITSLSCG